MGFKFPELWNPEFLDSLEQTTKERAREFVDEANIQQGQKSAADHQADELKRLKETFLQLAGEVNRNNAGLKLEQLLNQLFSIFDLNPRSGFRVTGEQIDGSFELDGQIYLMEAKWENKPLAEADLLVFRGKIEGKSTFTRGVFIAINDVSTPAKEAITRGKSPSFFVMNGYDLLMILSDSISLPDFIRKRIRLLGDQGMVFVPYSEI